MLKQRIGAPVFSRILFPLAIALSILPQAHAQNTANQCIDGCFGLACSANPVGSSAKQACIDRCLSTCQTKTVNPWGAIAYSKSDKISGWAYEQADKATAENMAMRYCTRQGGKQCQVVNSFYRTCASIAADGNAVGWGTGGNKETAQQQAMGQCARSGGRNCAVEAWSCSAPNTGSPSSSSNAPAPRSTPVPRAASWGAIAYSARDMGAGWSQGKNDRASAEREAMMACAQRGKSCVLHGAFNKECGALAADGAFTGWSAATDQRQALQKAMDACKAAGGSRCVPHIAFCSF